MTIGGVDKVGRLVQESAPTIAYDGDFVQIIEKLAYPWFTKVSTSNARNRIVTRGKRGRKAAAADEAIVLKVKKKTWQVEPGQTRWKIINELASEAGYMVWSSGDGSELIVGQPNYKQGVQFLVCNPTADSSLPSTSTRLNFKESIADRFSLVMALGSGRGDAANYGESAVSQRYVIKDGPNTDGTGKDFVAPKRLILAERTLMNVEEARQYAQQEMSRRDFHKMICQATMPGHGQIVGTAAPTLYTPDTIARVIDEEQDPPVNGAFLIFECNYRSTRQGSESTEITAVPSGTVFVQ
jgi:prophage tail gpP-like protein